MVKEILRTKRLILEELDQIHFNDLCKLLSNGNVQKFFPKTPDEKESRVFFEKIKKKYNDDGFSFWAVIKKDDRSFIGICGLLKQIVDDLEETEVAYRINDTYWGNGYGTEAAKGCITYAKDVLQKESIISLILPANKQSIRVAEKNGMQFDKEVMFEGLLHHVYRIYLND